MKYELKYKQGDILQFHNSIYSQLHNKLCVVVRVHKPVDNTSWGGPGYGVRFLNEDFITHPLNEFNSTQAIFVKEEELSETEQ